MVITDRAYACNGSTYHGDLSSNQITTEKLLKCLIDMIQRESLGV